MGKKKKKRTANKDKDCPGWIVLNKLTKPFICDIAPVILIDEQNTLRNYGTKSQNDTQLR